MIKIYKIARDKLDELKKILEAQEKESGEAGVEIEVGEGKKKETVKAAKWQINEFKRQGFILRDAKALGLEKDCSYLYIEASEDFFARNEKKLLDAGAVVVEGDEFEKVREKIGAGEEAAAEGVGFLFK